jgi:hypothetical protein
MSRYVDVRAESLEEFLSGCGFSRSVQRSEIVYVRSNDHFKGVVVKVYTSIRAGQATARPCGADAIRVVAAYQGEREISPGRGRTPSRSFGIWKGKKILRIGSEEAVIGRIYERMREAYAFTNTWVRERWRDING